jgi:C-terminal processing protease CtpA/Prc
MIHRIRDGHGEVGHDDLPRRSALPVRLELVDGQAVITGTSQPDAFAVGDVVESIDGAPVMQSVARVAAELSGSEHWRRFKAATWVVPSGPRGQSANLTLRRGEKARTLSARFVREAPPRPRRPDAIHRFGDGVFYVDLTRAHWTEIEARMPEIAAAPGVVFDLRGYPEDTHRVLEHLLREPEDATWMHVPRFVEPGGTPVAWHDIGWHLRPTEPRISGTIAFLVSAEAISYAESVLAYVDAHDLGTVIGSTPSAGTNGDIVRVDTVGGWWFIFTGMRVTHHDGRPFHLRGIAPDVVVEPTLAGLRSGRDEQLDAAVAFVRG